MYFSHAVSGACFGAGGPLKVSFESQSPVGVLTTTGQMKPSLLSFARGSRMKSMVSPFFTSTALMFVSMVFVGSQTNSPS